MSRLLFIVAAAAVVWWLLRAYRRPSAPPPAVAQDMVACAHCGVHLPKAEAVREGERYFCSEEHRRARH